MGKSEHTAKEDAVVFFNDQLRKFTNNILKQIRNLARIKTITMGKYLLQKSDQTQTGLLLESRIGGFETKSDIRENITSHRFTTEITSSGERKTGNVSMEHGGDDGQGKYGSESRISFLIVLTIRRKTSESSLRRRTRDKYPIRLSE